MNGAMAVTRSPSWGFWYLTFIDLNFHIGGNLPYSRSEDARGSIAGRIVKGVAVLLNASK